MAKIFVGSLPTGISEEMLRSEFSKYGDVEEIFVKQGCEPGRQWAMVKYASQDQARMAKESCDRILIFPGGDKPCDVMLAKNQGKGAGGPAYGGGAYPPAGGYEPAGLNGYGAAPMGGAPATATGTLARKIFVGSLPDGIQDEILRTEFGRYGSVEDIFIKPNCEPGRQWAFVSFSSHEQAAAAVEATNGLLQFPGVPKPCEVTLARHQGMFGQDPLLGAGGVPQYSMPAPHGGMAALPAPAPAVPKKVFVGSLPDNITDAALRAEFSKFGVIVDVFVKTGCETNRQWAFITFESQEQAQHAKESCDRILVFPGADRPCEVTIARHQGKFGKESDDDQYGGYGGKGAAAAPSYGGAYASSPLEEGPKKVFVGSLPDGINEASLQMEFSKYGQVLEVFLKQGMETGRQWAFVTFASAEQAQYAKDSTDRVLMFPGQQRTCEVTLARNQGKFGQAPIGHFGGRKGSGPPPAAAPPPAAGGGPQPPPPSTPPPAHLTPWRMYKTASGLPYYHNASTGITQWEAPPDFQVPGPGGYSAAAAAQPAYDQRYAPY